MAREWTRKDIPDQKGRVVIVTGGNSGIGYEAALVLAGRNARGISAVRSVDKGEQAAQIMSQRCPEAEDKEMAYDLAALKTMRSLASAFLASYDRLIILF